MKHLIQEPDFKVKDAIEKLVYSQLQSYFLATEYGTLTCGFYIYQHNVRQKYLKR